MATKSKSELKGWKNVGVMLPPSIIAIITAAGGADPTKGGMPYAMASIVGALPWIAVALYGELPREEYDAFAQAAKGYLQQAWEVIGAQDPKATFDRLYEEAKRSVQ